MLKKEEAFYGERVWPKGVDLFWMSSKGKLNERANL